MVVRTPHKAPLARDRAEEPSSLLTSTTRMLVAAGDDDPERLRIYAELAGELLDRAPVEDRAAVARLLAEFPPAPRVILRRLARDAAAVAEPILTRAMTLTAIDLLGLLAVVPESHATWIAGRAGLADDVMLAIVNRGEAVPVRALLENPAFKMTAELANALAAHGFDDPVILGAIGRAPAATDASAAPLFGTLDGAARARVIATLEARRVLAARPGRAPTAASPRLDAAALFTLATRGAWDAIGTSIAEALRLAPARVAASLSDPGGEPLIVLLRAGGVPAADAIRIALFRPTLGRDVAVIRWLGELNDRLTAEGALLLVEDWRGRETRVDQMAPASRADLVQRPEVTQHPDIAQRPDITEQRPVAMQRPVAPQRAEPAQRQLDPAEGTLRPAARPLGRPADRAIAILRARLASSNER